MVDLSIPIELHGFEELVEQGFGDPRLGQKPVRPWEQGETRFYVIQFTHSLFEEERTAIQERFGLELEAYIPSFAYIERVGEETVAGLIQQELVNGLFPLEAVNKQSPGIGEIVFQDPDRDAVEGFRLWATLFSDEDLDLVLAKLTEANATDIRVHDDRQAEGLLRIEFTIDSLDPLREIAEIETVNWIEEDPDSSPSAGIPAGWLWGGVAELPAAADGLRGEDEIVGVLDDELLTVDHCWFRDPNEPTYGPLHRKMIACHGSAGDPPTHAAFVAGILCGEDLADPARRGIAYKAKFAYANRDLVKDGTLTLYQVFSRMRENKATVINNSWRSRANPPYNLHSVDTDRFAWRNERILIVGSAANTGEVMGPPGSGKNALSVGAAYVDDNVSCLADVGLGTEKVDGELTGNVEGGRRKPDLLAPGCNIASVKLDGAVLPCDIISDADLVHGAASPGNPECDPVDAEHPPAYCASSYATAVASAAAAIVRQYFMQGWHTTGNPGGPQHRPTAALLKAMLLNATEQLSVPAGGPYPAIGSGWGLLQLDRVLRLPGEVKKIAFWDIPNAQGFFRNPTTPPPHKIRVNSNTKPLKITLVWTEPPGDLKSENPVVNNLDLVVRSPSNATYRGNWFAPATGASAPDTPLQPAQPDPANNVEMVLVKQPEPGDWNIFVVPTEVNAGRNGQGYALVARGDLA